VTLAGGRGGRPQHGIEAMVTGDHARPEHAEGWADCCEGLLHEWRARSARQAGGLYVGSHTDSTVSLGSM